MSISDHIEITTQHPGSTGGWADAFELVQEIKSKFRRRRSINICNEQRIIQVRGGEVDRQGIRSRARIGACENSIRPS
jgi:hypothetical protein